MTRAVALEVLSSGEAAIHCSLAQRLGCAPLGRAGGLRPGHGTLNDLLCVLRSKDLEAVKGEVYFINANVPAPWPWRSPSCSTPACRP